MDANINKGVKPVVLGTFYKKQTVKVPEESLLDENYFMNSEVLTGIPGIASEDEQDYLLTGSTSSPLHSLQSMEKERTTATELKTEGEGEIHISNLRLTDFLPQLNNESTLQTVRKDLSLSRERAVQEPYTSKESDRAGIFQGTFSRDSGFGLKAYFDTNQGQMEDSSRGQLVAQAPDSNFREPGYNYSSKSTMGENLGNSYTSNVRIKEEPMDEDYDRALAPPISFVDKVKDEPDNSEEYSQQPKTSEGELKISAVFSVSGSPLAPQLSSGVQAPVTSPEANKSVPAVPAVPPPSVRVSCSGCKKILQKGQTAYQRKGSTQLFCSTLCLTGYTVPPVPRPAPASKKTCSSCSKVIAEPKDVITAQFENPSGSKDFCSQPCLASYEKKATLTIHTNSISTKCSVCLKNAVIRHEVNYQNVVHKLCSDVCFSKFRSANNLTMNCCENCGGYCYSGSGQCHLLNIDGQCKKFCSSTCVTAFKQKSAKITPCALCKTLRSSAEMIENTNNVGRTELYCSVNCLSAYRVQSVTSSGIQIQCNSCKMMAVPQYHLAMSDGSIRNFCTYNCVVSFQNLFSKSSGMNSSVVPLSQGQVIMNINAATATQAGNSTPSVVSATSTSSSSTVTSSAAVGLQRLAAAQTQSQQQNSFSRLPVKLRCLQCNRLFANKPELLDYKGKMHQFCGKACCDEYKKINMVIAMCEYCKIEKTIKEVVRFTGIEKAFCSEGCKLLYKHDLSKKWGNYCKVCSYCCQTSSKLVRNHFGGRLEEFCGEECMSKYTVLFYQMGKCESCKRQGKLCESLKWKGDMKHFCNLMCVLVFCNQQSTADPSPVSNTASNVPMVQAVPASTGSSGAKDSTPVIANVVSLASAPATQPTANSNNVLQGAVPTVTPKIIGDASTQTDALKLPASQPPRLLKNKALLCKPITQTKATSCKPHTQHKECQTEDDGKPQILVLPVPVPVFIPIPMHLYTQFAPVPLSLPFPVPVPMLIPTTLDNADKIIDAIEDLKEKVPSDPFEADILQMAEMIAEDEEKEKTLSHGDQGSTYSGDLESEAVSTPHSWEDELNHYTLKSNNVQEPDSEIRQLSRVGTEQDLELDFPTEAFDPLSKGSSFFGRARGRRKHRDGFPQPKRRGRKKSVVAVEPRNLMQGSYPGCSALGSTLKYMYGVNAWKNWVRWKNSQEEPEDIKFGGKFCVRQKHHVLFSFYFPTYCLVFSVRPVKFKEDILSCTFAELSYGLCQFIHEVRRPNGEKYNADSILYLCLGVQQFLFENGRIDNIFTEPYSRFMVELTKLLKSWHLLVLPNGYMFSRIEEEHLWECKQLGAYSPIILLNTLLFFTTKFFQLKTMAEHQQLSFAYVMRRTKTLKYNTKTTYLRFMPPFSKSEPEHEKVLGKRKRSEDEDGQFVMEMAENTDNPLRCPVRLYEFYLSKCSESVKQRSDVFYLQPERSCVPNSPMWFSTLPIDPGTLDSMLTRILMVREVHEELTKAKEDSEGDLSD
ncbi:LOW QUALITY PROTEIN: zinc finger MYM-type protein 4 [Ranitomeya variabilis]|uniref:LOW QUALITY PROTEIN: zinc finger MYM-type protein 4 n=1 Tax=Ranitomeya variabilis TaxID=490064 RepID=UPI0040563CBF